MTRKINQLALLAAFMLAGCTVDGNMLQMGGRGGNTNVLGLLSAGGQFLNAASLGEKDEDVIGQSVAATITSRYPPVASTGLQRYANLVGLTVANASPRPDGNWVFGVIDSPDVNAFSGPNGYVLVTRGALMRMQDEAELAGVLAHECAHVCNHDGLTQVKAAEQKGALVNAMKAADSRTAQVAVFADSGIDVITKQGYSQPEEFKADEDAVRIMAAAGYDPNSYLNFLRRLQASGGSGGGSQLMSTHPGIGQRIARVQAAIAGLPRTGPTNGATLQARFAFNLQGMPAAGMPPVAPTYAPQPGYPTQPTYRPGN